MKALHRGAILCSDIPIRHAFNSAIPWAEEASNSLCVRAGFLSCACLSAEDQHRRVDFVVSRFSRKIQGLIPCSILPIT